MAILNKEKSSKCVHRYLILKHKSAKWTHTILKWTWNEGNHQLLRFAFSHICDDDDAFQPVAAHGSLNFAGRGWCVAAGCSSWLFKFRGSRMMRCSWLQLVALFKFRGSRTMRCRRLQLVALSMQRRCIPLGIPGNCLGSHNCLGPRATTRGPLEPKKNPWPALYISRVMDKSRQTCIITIEQYN